MASQNEDKEEVIEGSEPSKKIKLDEKPTALSELKKVD
jgi:hypothetical protein